jgi:hypothetical protein
MADVFEARKELDAERARLWELIAVTPALDWLLLTKRPENVLKMTPWSEPWPANVWLGTTVESEKFAEKRMPELVAAPAVIHFVSCEPLLGALDLKRWLSPCRARSGASRSVDWVIAGGESGGHSRQDGPDVGKGPTGSMHCGWCGFSLQAMGGVGPERPWPARGRGRVADPSWQDEGRPSPRRANMGRPAHAHHRRWNTASRTRLSVPQRGLDERS